MPNLTSIGAGIYTALDYVDMTVVTGTPGSGEVSKDSDASVWTANFETRTTPTPGSGFVQWAAAADARSFGRIREFPNLGIPANIVNVPQYGQASSSQIVGQSDPPNLDFTFNYVPSEHYFIDDLRASGEQRLFRVRLSNGEQVVSTGGVGTNISGGTDAASTAGVLLPYEVMGSAADDGSTFREFSDFYFFGSVASFEITPGLTEATQLSVSLTIDGQLTGPYSHKNRADDTELVSTVLASYYLKAPNA